VRSGKSQTAPKTVDEYLARIDEPARATLEKVRAVIRSAAPKETTEAISYGIPVFRYKGALVGFGVFAKHCSFFPMSPPVVKAFEAELAGYDTSKGTIRFPKDRPLPATLIKKIVKAKVAENERWG
jgi:uncharacterized protein YdhG (YjbR/CyaY superfamily)